MEMRWIENGRRRHDEHNVSLSSGAREMQTTIRHAVGSRAQRRARASRKPAWAWPGNSSGSPRRLLPQPEVACAITLATASTEQR